MISSDCLVLVVVLFVLLIILFGLPLLAWSKKGASRTIELHYRQYSTYCHVWSPSLPGKTGIGQTLGPALALYLKDHGEKLGICVVEEPAPIKSLEPDPPKETS